MALKTLLFTLILAILPGAARADSSRAYPLECAGIELRSYERIESQGFLGLLTPKADYRVVEDALRDGVELEGLRRTALAQAWGWDQFQAHTPWRLRNRHSWMQIVANDFRLAQLCKMAHSRGLKRLTFACVSDTHSGPDRIYPKGTFGQVDESTDWVDAECFVSAFQGQNASLDELRAARWGKPAQISEAVSPRNRHDAVADSGYRRELYMDLLNQALAGIAPYRLPEAPAPSAGAPCPETGSAPLAPGALPVNSSLPPSTSSMQTPN